MSQNILCFDSGSWVDRSNLQKARMCKIHTVSINMWWSIKVFLKHCFWWNQVDCL